MRDFHERQVGDVVWGRDVHGVVWIKIQLQVNTYEEGFFLGPETVMGMPEIDREGSKTPGGIPVVVVTYSGEANGNPSQSNEAGAIGRITYGLKPQFGEEPIETHPELKELMDNFAGRFDKQSGRVIFDTELPKGLKMKLGQRSNATRNPMSGVDKWKPVLVTWTRNYAARAIPQDILSRIGKVITNPPGNPPSLPGRTKWLVECPETEDSDSGNVVRVSEVYSLLPEEAPEAYYRTFQS